MGHPRCAPSLLGGSEYSLSLGSTHGQASRGRPNTSRPLLCGVEKFGVEDGWDPAVWWALGLRGAAGVLHCG